MHLYLALLSAFAVAASGGLGYALYRVRKQHKLDLAHYESYRKRKRSEIDHLKEKIKWMNMTMGGAAGGVFQRLNENRELAEALLRHAPDLLTAEPRRGISLALNQQFFTRLCDVMEFRDPHATISGPYRPTTTKDPFWDTLKAGDIASLRKQIPAVPKNPNRCSACLGSDSLGDEWKAMGICGGCGERKLVYDLEAIAEMEEKEAQTGLNVVPAPDVPWSML